MLTTHGLTHVTLAVRDPERSLQFYRDMDPDGYEVEIWFEPPTPFDPLGPAVETSLAGR